MSKPTAAERQEQRKDTTIFKDLLRRAIKADALAESTETKQAFEKWLKSLPEPDQQNVLEEMQDVGLDHLENEPEPTN